MSLEGSDQTCDFQFSLTRFGRFFLLHLYFCIFAVVLFHHPFLTDCQYGESILSLSLLVGSSV